MQTTLGVSNVSFGLNPAARAVLNSVFLARVRARPDWTRRSCTPPGSCRSSRIPDEQQQVALRPGLRPAAGGLRPAGSGFLELFEGVDAAAVKASRAAELAGAAAVGAAEAPHHRRRARSGWRRTWTRRSRQRPALEIVNDVLLDGMKTVGELFGSGQMQLPFVLQSAEVMKTAVAYLEPHMERSDEAGKGRIVLATVKGDVHDIGKNLVDIILSNNGYDVVNLGIKQPISAILEAADEHRRRRHRHVRPAGQVHRGDAGEPGGAELPRARRPVAGAARRRRADPRLRRAGPGRACSTARSATPATRSRGCG